MIPLRNLVLICLVLGPSVAWAGPLKVSESEIQYGNLKEGPPVAKKVILTNTGSEKLTIANVKTSCACTTVALDRRDLKPGESTALEITYKTLKYAGKFEKFVTIFSGASGKDETVITLKGFVEAIPMGKLEMVPRKSALGLLKTGRDNQVSIVLKNIGDASLTVTKVVSRKFKTVYFDGSALGNLAIQPNDSRNVNFTIKPPESGDFIDIITIYSDGRNDTGDGYKGVLAGTAQ